MIQRQLQGSTTQKEFDLNTLKSFQESRYEETGFSNLAPHKKKYTEVH